MVQDAKVAAVFLNHRDNADTLRLVREFSGFKGIRAIAVVDNSVSGGLSGSEPELRNAKVRFLKTENEGYARGNNKGFQLIEDAFGPFGYILFSNTDIRVEACGIEQCVDYLHKHPEAAVAAPRMLMPSGEPHPLPAWRERDFLCDLSYSSGLLSRAMGMGREKYPPGYWEQPVVKVDCISGSFFVIKRDIFEKAGRFDEHTFLFYEEDILAFRLKRMGYTEAVLNSCNFTHVEGISANRSISFLKKYWNMQKSRLYFQRRYVRIAKVKYALLCLATFEGACEILLKCLIFGIKGLFKGKDRPSEN